jgi:hypothetical protein
MDVNHVGTARGGVVLDCTLETYEILAVHLPRGFDLPLVTRTCSLLSCLRNRYRYVTISSRLRIVNSRVREDLSKIRSTSGCAVFTGQAASRCYKMHQRLAVYFRAVDRKRKLQHSISVANGTGS